jgi:hypothetical protein
VCRTIVPQSPRQAGGEGVLWTRAAVAELIHRRFGIRLSQVSCGKYLRRWGLSPQKPIRRAYEKDPEKVRTWLQETYPQIVARARTEHGIVVWLDQSGVGSADAPGSTWAPVGATPVLGKSGQRFRINLMAALTNRGALSFTVHEGSLTIEIYTRFLDRLARHHGRRVHLIVDQHPTHKSAAVKAWLAAHADQIEQHLPGYSPELNPVELLNGDTNKRNATMRSAVRGEASLVSCRVRTATMRDPWVSRRNSPHSPHASATLADSTEFGPIPGPPLICSGVWSVGIRPRHPLLPSLLRPLTPSRARRLKGAPMAIYSQHANRGKIQILATYQGPGGVVSSTVTSLGSADLAVPLVDALNRISALATLPLSVFFIRDRRAHSYPTGHITALTDQTARSSLLTGVHSTWYEYVCFDLHLALVHLDEALSDAASL